MSVVARKAILAVAGNRFMTKTMTRHGLKSGAGRFVAGETLSDALQVARRLNQQGLAVTLDLLGESVSSRTQAEAAADSAADILEAIAAAGLDANLSCKLTQLGLEIDPELALANAARIQNVATRTKNFFRIDMESSAVTDVTLDIFKKLYAQDPNVGIVLQSYLYRTPKDLEPLSQMGVNVRFVKGAYLEPPTVAYPTKQENDQAFVRLVQQHLGAGGYTAIATHDDAMIAAAEQYVNEHKIPRSQFEFQMLYGIRTERQLELAKTGYRTRVYVPFGHDWYPYFVRRLAERPANVWFVAKNLFRG